jgi:hypothetical protein
VVVVSDDDEGGGVTAGAGGGAAPYSVVVVVSLVAVGPHAVQKPTDNAPIDMIAHDFQFCILLILRKNLDEPTRAVDVCSLARGNFRARLACFGQTDSDGLLAAFDFPARLSGLEFAALHFMHYAPHFGGSLLAVFSGLTVCSHFH